MKIQYSIITILLLTITTNCYSVEFQYAEFTEISYTSKNRNPAIILSFVTDPGNPILVMSK